MKNLKVYSILGLSALFVLSACEKDEFTEEANPVLTLSQTTLTVSTEGAVVSVAYKVENPVDGASVSVDLGDVTWVTNLDVTDSTIDLTVEANSDSDSRTATFTVSYPGAEDASLTVVQDGVGIQYNHDLSEFTGYFYKGYGNSGEDLFYIWLSDIGFDADGYTQAGGHYYNFYLFVNEADGSTLPTGTFTASTSYGGDMTFYNNSRYLVQSSTGYTTDYLVDGYLTVSADGDTYTIEGTVLDENGDYHSISYTGSAKVTNRFLEDLEFTAETAVATYYTHNTSGVMNVDIMFTNMEYDGTYVYPPGVYMTLDTYMPFDKDGKIAEGTYEVNNSLSSMSIYPVSYSYVYNYASSDTDDYTYGTISSGTMIVTSTGIVCEFMTSAGSTVKCTYEGTLTVDGVPDAYSTLTENTEVTVPSNCGVDLYNYGDYYLTGGVNWLIRLTPTSSTIPGQFVYFEIVAEQNSDGLINPGTYTVSSTSQPNPGEFLYGGQTYYAAWNWTDYTGTWYFEYDANWNIVNEAPAFGGELTIGYDSGVYTFEFNFLDDLGFSWYGSWSGSLTSATSLSTDSVTSMARKTAQKEPNVKVSAKESRIDAVSKTLKVN